SCPRSLTSRICLISARLPARPTSRSPGCRCWQTPRRQSFWYLRHERFLPQFATDEKLAASCVLVSSPGRKARKAGDASGPVNTRASSYLVSCACDSCPDRIVGQLL